MEWSYITKLSSPMDLHWSFNSYSTEWDYITENEHGEMFINWSSLSNTYLVYDAK